MSGSPSARPAPAAASRSSAPARPTSPTPPARSSPRRRRSARRTGSSTEAVQVAVDALTVVGNPENPVTCLSVDQLAEIWGPDTTATSWSDVPDLDAEYDEELARYGPGTDSGTFDYFTDAVNGEEGVQTKDYNNVGEDDNATVTGVSGRSRAASATSATRSSSRTRARSRRSRSTAATAASLRRSRRPRTARYAPLARPLYIYPNTDVFEDEAQTGVHRLLPRQRQQRCRGARVHPAHGRAADRVRGRAGLARGQVAGPGSASTRDGSRFDRGLRAGCGKPQPPGGPEQPLSARRRSRACSPSAACSPWSRRRRS